MPRYFFNVQDGRYIPDSQGTDLADDDHAKFAALDSSTEMLRGSRSVELWTGKDWVMKVTDQDGRTVATLRVSGTVA